MNRKEWDQSLKFLTKQNPQSFVSFLLEGAEFLREIDKELQSRTLLADLVYEVQWHGETIILHVEFQSSRNEMMARRVWEYNVLVGCATQLPVYSVVLYLVKDGIAIEPPYEQCLSSGELIHHFRFRNLKLWEVDASELRQPGMEGMLPLLPLTRNGACREVVEETILDLARVKRQDLLPVAYLIAALAFPVDGVDTEWLKERFRPMLNLFHNSWAYQELVADGKQEGRQEGLLEGLQEGRQEGLQEGRQEGRQEVLQETCIRYIEKRFPALTDQAKSQIGSISDIKRLQDVFDAMIDATTSAEVARILMRFSDEAQATS
jgi:predicted transposase YdaD